MTQFPDQQLELNVDVALGADLTADPSTWVWTSLGKLHAGHQVAMLGEAGLLDTPNEDAAQQCQAETRSWDHFRPEQIDSYWIRCTQWGPHDRHKDGHTGLTWTNSTP